MWTDIITYDHEHGFPYNCCSLRVFRSALRSVNGHNNVYEAHNRSIVPEGLPRSPVQSSGLGLELSDLWLGSLCRHYVLGDHIYALFHLPDNEYSIEYGKWLHLSKNEVFVGDLSTIVRYPMSELERNLLNL